MPVLTVHAIDDPIAFVETESTFRETMQQAGSADHLVQTFTDDHQHSYLAEPDYPTLFAALLRWVTTGERPTPAGTYAIAPSPARGAPSAMVGRSNSGRR